MAAEAPALARSSSPGGGLGSRLGGAGAAVVLGATGGLFAFLGLAAAALAGLSARRGLRTEGRVRGSFEKTSSSIPMELTLGCNGPARPGF